MNKIIKKFKKAHAMYLIIFIIIIILMGIALTYAFIKVNTSTSTLPNITASAECINITYSESTTLGLDYNYPISDKFALENVKPVTISIINTCTNNIAPLKYTLGITSLSNTSGYISDNKIRILAKRKKGSELESVVKSTRYLNSLNRLTSGVIYDHLMTDLNKRPGVSAFTNKTTYIIDSSTVGNGNINTYKVYLWVDYYEGDTTHTGLNDNSTQGQNFAAAISLIVNEQSENMTPTLVMADIADTNSTSQTYNYTYDGTGTVSCEVVNSKTGITSSKASCSVNNTNKTVTLTRSDTGIVNLNLVSSAGTNNLPAEHTSNSFLFGYNTITYNLNGGLFNSEDEVITKYTKDHDSFIIPTPVKDEFEFGGWYETSNFSGSPITYIDTSNGKNYTLYAKWIDTTMPTVTVNIPSTSVSSEVQVSVTASDVSGIASVNIECGGVSYVNNFTPNTVKDRTITQEITLSKIGNNTVKVTVRDSAGNSMIVTKTVLYNPVLVNVTYNATVGKFANSSNTKTVLYTNGADLQNGYEVPSMSGYTFVDWYKDSDCTEGNVFNPSTAPSSLTSDTQVYACWTNYTNMIPYALDYDLNGIYNGVGYRNGYYVSTTSPYTTATTDGSVVTGLWELDWVGPNQDGRITPPTIYIKGVTFDSSNGHNRFGYFSQDFMSIYTTKKSNELSPYYTIETLGTQYYKLTPVMQDGRNGYYVQYMNSAWQASISHFAISANGNGANMIVTFNEPIEFVEN